MKYRYRRITDHIAPLLILIVFACLVFTLIASLFGMAFPYQTLVRSHLLWLEVFGVLLGMVFSGALYFVMRVLSIPM